MRSRGSPSGGPARRQRGVARRDRRRTSCVLDVPERHHNVLFADVWARPELSPRDRSLVTVSALIAMNRPDQLRSHLARARENGVTQEELVEAITHLAFYAGWPNAVTAIAVAKEVFEKK